MIIAESTKKNVTNAKEQIKIGISEKNVPHLFKMLSQSLYNDKIGAVVREIICNARDANLDNNSQKPIEIRCETYPAIFSVRDFGKGLSHEEIKTVFASLGESTKRENKDAIGFYGIGSKSPFAYTDSFVITSVHDGIKKVYNCVNSNQGPLIEVMGEPIETNDLSGITIQVPLKKSLDAYTFQGKIKKFLTFFDTEVQYNKELQPKFKSGHILYSEDEASIVDITDIDKYASYVRMGGVCYKFDPVEVGYTSLRKGIMINVPLGSIEVPPAREEMSYDQVSKQYINGVLKRYEKKITESLNNLDFSNGALALLTIGQVKESLYKLGLKTKALKEVKTPFKAVKKVTSDETTTDDLGLEVNKTVEVEEFMDCLEWYEMVSSYLKLKYHRYSLKGKKRYHTDDCSFNLISKSAQDLKEIFIANTSTNLKERIKSYCNEHENLYYISENSINKLKEYGIDVYKFPITLKKFSEITYDTKERVKSVRRQSYKIEFVQTFGRKAGKLNFSENDLGEDAKIVVVKCKSKNEFTDIHSITELKALVKEVPSGYTAVLVKERYYDDFMKEYSNAICWNDLYKSYVGLVNKYKVHFDRLTFLDKECRFFDFVNKHIGELPSGIASKINEVNNYINTLENFKDELYEKISKDDLVLKFLYNSKYFSTSFLTDFKYRDVRYNIAEETPFKNLLYYDVGNLKNMEDHKDLIISALNS